MVNRKADQVFLDVADGLPGYTWGSTYDGITIAYVDPETDRLVWIAGTFTTCRDALIALGRRFA